MAILARYDPEPDQSRALLSVHALGIDHRHEGRIQNPAGSHDWVIIQFHDPAPVLVREGERVVPRDTVVIWEPLSPTVYGLHGRAVRHSWLRCHGTHMASWLQQAGIASRCMLTVRDPQALMAWWHLLHEECSSGGQHDPRLLQELMRLFLRRLSGQAGQAAIPAGILAARRFIATHWQRPLRLEGLARVAGMGRSSFAAGFRRAFGIPPMDLVLRLRLAHAATLLEDSGLSVEEVALASGFSEPCHFSRSFRARQGMSPLAYRRRSVTGTLGLPASNR